MFSESTGASADVSADSCSFKGADSLSFRLVRKLVCSRRCDEGVVVYEETFAVHLKAVCDALELHCSDR